MTDAVWHQSYEPGVPTTVGPIDGPFHRALVSAAAEAPGQPALEFLGRVVSFAELEASSGRVAAALLRDGLGPGELVVVALPTCTTQFAACLGVLRAGGVVVPVEPSPKLLASVAGSLSPRVVFATTDLAGRLGSAQERGDASLVAVDVSRALPLTVRALLSLARLGRTRAAIPAGAQKWSRWLARAGAGTPDVPGTAMALILAGSGAESRWPRFAHEQLAAGAAQLSSWLTDAAPGHDIWLVLSPLWSAFGFVAALGAAASLRARVLLLSRGDASDTLDALRYRRPAIVLSGAASSTAMASDPRLTGADLRSVRAWITDGPVESGRAQALRDRLGMGLCEAFGHRSVAGLATCCPINGKHVPGSVGVPLPDVEVRIVDEDGHPVASGETGRIELRGPNVSSRGWMRPGVRARMDDGGYVFLEPRRSGAQSA